jgi:hypothetical protein
MIMLAAVPRPRVRADRIPRTLPRPATRHVGRHALHLAQRGESRLRLQREPTADDAEERQRNIRSFLSMIEPRTGYIEED